MDKKVHFENVFEFSESTHTAQDAANQLGCNVAQIAKSIIFRTLKSDQPIIVIASGINRIDEKKICKLVGEEVEKANANYSREKTGFVIGGIAPYGHLTRIKTFFDNSLFQYDVIWASAGTPNSVFKTTPTDLLSKSLATRADIALK